MKLNDKSPMPIGTKYFGVPLGKVPDQYLLLLYNKGLQHEPLKAYIEENLDAIRANVERQKFLKNL